MHAGLPDCRSERGPDTCLQVAVEATHTALLALLAWHDGLLTCASRYSLTCAAKREPNMSSSAMSMSTESCSRQGAGGQVAPAAFDLVSCNQQHGAWQSGSLHGCMAAKLVAKSQKMHIATDAEVLGRRGWGGARTLPSSLSRTQPPAQRMIVFRPACLLASRRMVNSSCSGGLRTIVFCNSVRPMLALAKRFRRTANLG